MSDVVLPPTDSAAADTPPFPSGQAPISALARTVLQRRLRKVVQRISQCARTADMSPEEVHGLRVAIRRCAAALDTFRPLLPKRRIERFSRRLKHVRKVAGKVRDLDVLLERLLTAQLDPVAVDSDESDELLDSRHRLVRKLRRAARNEQQCELKCRARGIARRVRWRGDDDEPTTSAIAPTLLEPIAERCRKNGARDLTSVRRLHHFRISVKRLRYACEFVQPGLNLDACRQLQELLSGLQQRLGDICDHAATIRLLERPGITRKGDAADLVAREQAALAALQTRFVAWWEPGGREQFERAIAGCRVGSDHHCP